MQLVRALYEWGFLRNDPIRLNGVEFGIMQAIGAYLMQSRKAGKPGSMAMLCTSRWRATVAERRRHTLWHTHPPSYGSVPDWAGLRAYTRNVAVPMSIGAQMLGKGLVKPPAFSRPRKHSIRRPCSLELAKRQILVHSRIEELEPAGKSTGGRTRRPIRTR